MWVALHWSRLSIVGVSMAGGVFHMVGQLAVVAFTFSPYVALVYLPVLMISGLVTGLLTGYVCRLVIRATAKSNLFKSRARELARREGVFCKMALVGGLGFAGLADCDTSAAVQSGDARAEPGKASTFAFNTLVNITAYGADDASPLSAYCYSTELTSPMLSPSWATTHS